ncbi:MAG: hypothetical protein ACXABY_00530 [Candidatus Thorarchaeota archaeon]|jgi:hypothetical protein
MSKKIVFKATPAPDEEQRKISRRLLKAIGESKGVNLSASEVLKVVKFKEVFDAASDVANIKLSSPDPNFNWSGWEDELVSRFPEEKKDE